ncbi:tyrosine-protein phosphatase [Methyloligella solikamskensis]|uniref:Tyrosine-protein phosphatase n=1 Tax=Methyloligella solikamskensis TaxID=1177756 RepID=A0ABW3JCP1_9HYPH
METSKGNTPSFGLQAKRVGIGALVMLGLMGAYLGMLELSGNFRAVIPGELYRSGQPTAAAIARYRAAHGIKTIINLRGENAGRDWYDTELAESEKLGITHLNFRMSAKHELSQAKAAELIDMMAAAEKPLLIHCSSGADRTGLASALYVAAVAKLGEIRAEDQLTPVYGHIPLPFLNIYAMDDTFEKLEPWLGFPDS